MSKRWYGAALLAALAAVTSLALVASSGAAGPPLPTAANGNAVEVVATGVPTPTAFAFTGSTVFAASGPDESTGGPGGLSLPSVSINGATGTELSTALGTVLRYTSGGVAYTVLGSVQPFVAEQAAKALTP